MRELPGRNGPSRMRLWALTAVLAYTRFKLNQTALAGSVLSFLMR